jgi:hypothetical protein
MITINLLPEQLRPVNRAGWPYIVTVIAIVLCVFVCLRMFIETRNDLNTLNETYARNQEELESLRGSVDQYLALAEEKKMLANQLTTISEIASNRTIWSEQLHNLTRLALPNMWYDKIEVDTVTVTVTTEEIDPTTKKVKKTKTKVRKRVLVLEGFVAPNKSGQTSINPFTTGAEQDEEFSTMFQLEEWGTSETTFQDVDVRAFALEYEILPRGSAQ